MSVMETTATTFVVTLAADPPRLTAGALTGSTISVVVVRSDNAQPPANGTEVVLNTNLGNFGVTAQGDPIQLVRLALRGGRAETTLLAEAEDVGIASLLAQVSDSSAQLNVPIGEPGELPAADFEFAVDGFLVTFADASTGNPNRFSWDFGDGDGSGLQNPSHRFAAAGTYAVKLTVSNNAGSNSKSKLVTVPSGEPPAADFTFQIAGFRVNFLDASTGNPTSWSWRFGDDTTSIDQNPSHIYGAAGTFTVSLTVTSEVGSDTVSQLVTVPTGEAPAADFTFLSNGLTVNFSDASTGAPTEWAWDFGDGNTSRERNPIHSYELPGDYTVRLTVSNDIGNDTVSQLVTVSLGEAPVADFTFLVNGLSVSFNDASTGGPTEWQWNFGDGNTSREQNPVHKYESAGDYTVRLIASNAAGSDTVSQLVTISLGDPPVADFTFVVVNGLTVNFIDASTGDPTDWQWSFGDGGTSGEQNPVHSYDNPGSYTASLTAGNDAGSDTTTQLVTVPAPLGADFSVQINDRTVIFTDRSTGDPTFWQWDFGDGSGGSQDQNPVHCYATDGTFAVSLTVSNGSDSNTTSRFIPVSDPDDNPCP